MMRAIVRLKYVAVYPTEWDIVDQPFTLGKRIPQQPTFLYYRIY
jgi:hypothetical protein